MISLLTEAAAAYQLQLVVYTDLNHRLDLDYGQLKIVDQGYQSVDLVLYNQIEAGDLVISSDYGLAALALSAGAAVLGFSGREFTAQNIDRLLAQRHLQQKARKRNIRQKGPGKRTAADDQNFKEALEKLIKKLRNER